MVKQEAVPLGIPITLPSYRRLLLLVHGQVYKSSPLFVDSD